VLNSVGLWLRFIESKPLKKEKIIEELNSDCSTEQVEHNLSNNRRDHHRAKIKGCG
jgi:hypothetical protein